MFNNFIFVASHALAPSFSISLHRRKFDTILMLLIGSPVMFEIAAPLVCQSNCLWSID